MPAFYNRLRGRFAALGLRPDGAMRRSARPSWAGSSEIVAFVLSFVVLNLCVNVTWFHRHLPIWSPLLPSLEILSLSLGLALAQGGGLRGLRVVRAGATVLLVCVVVLRLVDVGLRRFMRRELDVLQDLRLAPELLRLGLSTLPLWQFALAACLLLGALGVLGTLVWLALRTHARSLAHPRIRRGFYALVVGLGCLSMLTALVPSRASAGRKFGVFAPTYLPKLVGAGRRWWHMDKHIAQVRARVAEQRAQFSRRPANLARLAGRAVHLVFVESYGMSVFARPDYRAELAPDYARLQAELAAAGFQIRSGRLRSPSFGGQSWLAHATLSTGMRIDNHMDHELVLAAGPVTLAGVLSAAGYHTVGVWPGTTRPVPTDARRGFQEVIAAFDMDYAGPSYAWAPMPDQYVLDYARRRLSEHAGPLFVEYGLVSSHFPFSPHPTYVEDWAQIGDGRIYHDQKPADHGVRWHDRSRAPEAYLSCLRYDLSVLAAHIQRGGDLGGLYILLGDHQPLAEVAGDQATHEVPIHVISGAADLLAPFEARGYVPGWMPAEGPPAPSMEAFLPAFVQDFSR